MNSRFQETSFIALSHRGNSKEYLENSFEAFKSVVDKGYNFIETDLRKTLDNKIVTFHDKSLKRLFGIDLEVKNLSHLNQIIAAMRLSNFVESVQRGKD